MFVLSRRFRAVWSLKELKLIQIAKLSPDVGNYHNLACEGINRGLKWPDKNTEHLVTRPLDIFENVSLCESRGTWQIPGSSTFVASKRERRPPLLSWNLLETDEDVRMVVPELPGPDDERPWTAVVAVQ